MTLYLEHGPHVEVLCCVVAGVDGLVLGLLLAAAGGHPAPPSLPPWSPLLGSLEELSWRDSTTRLWQYGYLGETAWYIPGNSSKYHKLRYFVF